MKQHKDSPEECRKSDGADRDKISSTPVMCSLDSPDSPLRDLVTGGMTGEGVNVHENEYVICKPIHNLFGSQHSHSR